jgi:hypothetical protein
MKNGQPSIAVILLFGICCRSHLIVDGLSIPRIFKTFRKRTEVKLQRKKQKLHQKHIVRSLLRKLKRKNLMFFAR